MGSVAAQPLSTICALDGRSILYCTAGCCGGAQLGAGQPPLNADYSRQGKTKQQQLGNNLEIVQSNRPPLV